MKAQMRNKNEESNNNGRTTNRGNMGRLLRTTDNICGGDVPQGCEEMNMWEREVDEILEDEKVLVPVRRQEIQKEQEAVADQEIEVKPIPRRWMV